MSFTDNKILFFCILIVLIINSFYFITSVYSTHALYDEPLYAWQVKLVREDPTLFFSSRLWLFHPPLFVFISWPFYFLDPLASIRVVSYMFAIFSILLSFFIAKEVAGKRVAFFTFLILALSPGFLFYVGFGLNDFLLLGFFLLTILFILKKRYPIAWIFSILAILSKRSGVVASLVLLAYLWLDPTFRKEHRTKLHVISVVTVVIQILVLFMYLFRPSDAGENILVLPNLFLVLPYLFLASSGLLLFSIFGLIKLNSQHRLLFILWFLAFLPALFWPAFVLRYLLPLLPLLIITGLTLYDKQFQNFKKWQYLFPIFFLIVSLSFWFVPVLQSSDYDYTNLAHWTSANVKDDKILFILNDRSLRYYSGLEFYEYGGSIKPINPNQGVFSLELAETQGGEVFVVIDPYFTYRVPWLDQNFMHNEGFQKVESIDNFEIYSNS